MRTWLTEWKYEIAAVCAVVLIVGTILWRLAIWESPRYTIHHNEVTKKVYVQLHRDEDRKKWDTGRKAYWDKIIFYTVEEACAWVEFQKDLSDEEKRLKQAWKEIPCGSDQTHN